MELQEHQEVQQMCLHLHNILEKLLPYMNVYKDASDEYEDTSSSPDELTVDGIPAGTASSN